MNQHQRERLEAWIDTHLDACVADLRELVRVPSLRSDPMPGAPFGEPIARALDIYQQCADRAGLPVTLYEGYALHAEAGAGEDVCGVLTHVDVVPAGEGWSVDPFGAEVLDGYIYGRGTVDNKGATIAALYALWALCDLDVSFRRRVRLVVGADEESGWACMNHYLTHVDEHPVIGFSPDAAWPLVHGEKGILNVRLTAPATSADLRIEAGERPNMVPSSATAWLTSELPKVIEAAAAEGLEEGDYTADATGNGTRLTVLGKSAHGSTPAEGVNAAGRLLSVLLRLGYGLANPWMFGAHALALDIHGHALGIAGSDDVSGGLVSNLGTLRYGGDGLQIEMNIRYPVSWSEDDLLPSVASTVGQWNMRAERFGGQAPHYVPADDAGVQALLRVYREETGDHADPKVIGGGTYARVAPGLVSVGSCFDGDGPVHQADERLAIDSLRKLVAIYARMIYVLACEPTD